MHFLSKLRFRVLMGLALATLAAPMRGMECREEIYNCQNNTATCRWKSCIENGFEVYFLKKWCDGQVQEIINGNGHVVQEEPCQESGDGQTGEKHPVEHRSDPW